MSGRTGEVAQLVLTNMPSIVTPPNELNTRHDSLRIRTWCNLGTSLYRVKRLANCSHVCSEACSVVVPKAIMRCTVPRTCAAPPTLPATSSLTVRRSMVVVQTKERCWSPKPSQCRLYECDLTRTRERDRVACKWRHSYQYCQLSPNPDCQIKIGGNSSVIISLQSSSTTSATYRVQSLFYLTRWRERMPKTEKTTLTKPSSNWLALQKVAVHILSSEV